MITQNRSFKTYCIIGDPVSHSLSPSMQNAAFAALNLNCTYISFRVSRSELKASIESLRQMNIAGFNVTIPHKVDVMAHLDEIEEKARIAGAVNTVNNSDGTLVGYNTDVAAFIEPIHRKGISLADAKVLLLGAGGAARAILVALERERIGKLTIANQSSERAISLASRASEMGLRCETIALSDAQRVSRDSDLIVNATPLGLNGEPSPIGTDYIKKGTVVYDIIYRPIYTGLIENAKRAQAVVIFGYEMLLEQGAKSFEIWTSLIAPREAMKKSLLGLFGEPT